MLVATLTEAEIPDFVWVAQIRGITIGNIILSITFWEFIIANILNGN